ncbi:MAG: lysophospholipase, partial [Cyanobacteria bacterium]|nr:lysophospholipase [Cyanobacteriota bacterium]
MNLLTATPLRQYVKPMVMIVLLLAAAYVSVCLLLLWQQARFIFFPHATLEKTPETFDLPYETVWIPVTAAKDKPEHLHGWWIPARQPHGKVLLYLHGNTNNIGANVEHAGRFHRLGFSVLLVDYRGYGQSEGSFPSEQQVYADAEAAWHYLVQQRGINPEQIVIYGHSLGGAIAIELATRHPQASGLIVESSFTS